MNEFYVFDSKHTCCACMKIGEDLFTMTTDEISMYHELVKLENIHTNTVMKICFVCHSIFRKLLKFVKQCQRACQILSGISQKDIIPKYENSYTCVTTTHYVGPEIEISELNFDQYDDKYDDDDDMPLRMLRDTVKQGDVKVKKKNKKDVQNEETLENNQEEVMKPKNVRKEKKQLKEGFTSRMVQETNEYEVIKLSKEQIPIQSIIRHPSYNPPIRYYDIALIKLARPAELTAAVHPACLWTNPNITHTEAIAIGWGVSDVKTRQHSKILQKVALTLQDSAYCDRLLYVNRNRNWSGFSPEQLCAGELRPGKDTCQGDSGAPLQVKWRNTYRIVGITSFGLTKRRERTARRLHES